MRDGQSSWIGAARRLGRCSVLSGVGEELVRQIVAQTQALHQIVGGAAGDEGRF